MRTKTSLLIVALLFVGVATSQAQYQYTSTMYTASGHPVSVDHFGYCGPNGCPASDSSWESVNGIRSADRWYSGTGAWNCHGRTFDNRQGWIGQAEPWLTYDGPSSPVSPRPGDTVIWWKNDPILGHVTAHSVTINGTWNGLGTTVMSKYGTQGQYQHALSNPIRVYGLGNYSFLGHGDLFQQHERRGKPRI